MLRHDDSYKVNKCTWDVLGDVLAWSSGKSFAKERRSETAEQLQLVAC